MNRQQRVLMLFALLLISAVMLGCANNSTVDNHRSDTPPYGTDLARAREEIERTEAERNRIIAEERAREAAAAERAAQDAARELEAQARAAEEQRTRSASGRGARARSRARARRARGTRYRPRSRADARRRPVRRGHGHAQTGAATTIDRLAQFMRDYPERSVRIEGHTDSAGGDDRQSSALGAARRRGSRRPGRARPRSRRASQPLGYGEARPIAGNETASGRQQNRRIEIVVSDEQGSFGDDDRRADLQ